MGASFGTVWAKAIQSQKDAIAAATAAGASGTAINMAANTLKLADTVAAAKVKSSGSDGGGVLKGVTDWIGNTSGKIGEATKGILPTTITEERPILDGIGSSVKGVTDWVGNTSGAIGDLTGKYGKYIPLALAGVGGLVLLSLVKK